MPESDHEAALKVARVYNYHSFSVVICPMDDPCPNCKRLADLILDHERAAVKAARPEIERKARIDALDDARSMVLANAWGRNTGDHTDRILEDLDAEIATITQLKKEARDDS